LTCRHAKKTYDQASNAKKLIQKHMIDLPPSLTEHEQIECLAYHLYEDEGNPDGRADEHWARAEEFVHAQRLAIAASSEKSEA
jgi:hypothetical protein